MSRWGVYSEGQRFENFVLLENYDTIKTGRRQSCRAWICRCDHGIDFIASTRQIRTQVARCPCVKKERKKHRYPPKAFFQEGQRFHNFVVIGPSDKRVQEPKRSYVGWLCRCDCGNEFLSTSKSIKKRTSCGCASKSKRIKPKYTNHDSNINRVIRQYISGAKERNLSFSLTKKECLDLLCSDCHYCGSEPSRSVVAIGRILPSLVSGIDRKDCSVGYVAENVVSCCSICNRAKSDLSYDDFKAWINRLRKIPLQ